MSETNISRRTFLKRSAVAGAAASVITLKTNPVFADVEETKSGLIGSIIDLTKCDGCAAYDTPLCVTGCRDKNEHRFPQPEEPIKDYWPRKHHEDWSDKQHVTNRLTPYNWTYVEKVQVDHNGKQVEVSIPRRCMHCMDAPCQSLCPFGVINKSEQGAVIIDEDFCFGGAKCRTACPWDIPQRQAGVGLYLKIAPDLAGGGVMYKCDMCADLLEKGQKPACETSCPKDAIQFGPIEEMREMAKARAADIGGGYVYGDAENGGTLTFYVSEIPFEAINEAIVTKKQEQEDKAPGRPQMEPNIENMLESTKGYMLATLVAPIAGIATAGITAYKVMKGKKDQRQEGDEIE